MDLTDSDPDSDSDYELDDDLSLDSELSDGGDDDLELELDELQVDQGAGLDAEQQVNQRKHRKVVRVQPGQDYSRMFAAKRWSLKAVERVVFAAYKHMPKAVFLHIVATGEWPARHSGMTQLWDGIHSAICDAMDEDDVRLKTTGQNGQPQPPLKRPNRDSGFMRTARRHLIRRIHEGNTSWRPSRKVGDAVKKNMPLLKRLYHLLLRGVTVKGMDSSGHLLFQSISDARALSQEINAICIQLELSDATIWKQLKIAFPDLVMAVQRLTKYRNEPLTQV